MRLYKILAENVEHFFGGPDEEIEYQDLVLL